MGGPKANVLLLENIFSNVPVVEFIYEGSEINMVIGIFLEINAC